MMVSTLHKRFISACNLLYVYIPQSIGMFEIHHLLSWPHLLCPHGQLVHAVSKVKFSMYQDYGAIVYTHSSSWSRLSDICSNAPIGVKLGALLILL